MSHFATISIPLTQRGMKVTDLQLKEMLIYAPKTTQKLIIFEYQLNSITQLVKLFTTIQMYICPFVSVPPLLFQYCNQPVIFAFLPLQAGKPRDRKSVQTCCQCYTGIKKWGCDANGERKTVNDAKIDFKSTTFGDCLEQPR